MTDTATAPRWLLWVLRATTAALALVFFVPALFVATVMPYRSWDSLAYGSWSRLIEQSGRIVIDGVPDVFVQRPLFYVGQGMIWHWFGFHQAAGRWYSALFSVILVAALWPLAAQFAAPAVKEIVASLAVVVILACSVFAVYVAAGMTDVPVAACVTLMAALCFTRRLGRARAPLVGAAAAAAVLAKPTGLLGIVGVALALALAASFGAHNRPRLPATLIALLAGAGVGLLYAAIAAARLDESVMAFLTSGNDAYFRERGAAALHDRLLNADWLGESLRLPFLFGLCLAVARSCGARGRASTAIVAAVAVAWSFGGPALADGGAPYPFDGSSLLAQAGTITVLLLILAAVLGPAADPLPRWAWPAALAWILPVAAPAIAVRSDEVRFLSPAWAPMVILAAAGLTLGAMSIVAMTRPAAALVAVAAVGVLALTNVQQIDGLGGTGWNGLRALGRSGWSNQAVMENFAYGPFSYQIDMARQYAGPDGRIFSADGRLAFFFPGRVSGGYATSCADLRGHRVFALLTGDESRDQMERLYHSTADPLAWIQCRSPRVTMVQEQQGEYAAFVVGNPLPPVPSPDACHITSHAGQLDDAVFGENLRYEHASRLAARAKSVGYPAKLEQTGCNAFRVVVTGIPQDKAGQKSFRGEAAGAGLNPRFTAALRYPEVPVGVPPAVEVR